MDEFQGIDHTLAEQFRRDPRVSVGLSLIHSAMLDAQSRFNGVVGAVPGLSSLTKDRITFAGDVRGASLWFPYLGSGLGRGALVELIDGSVKLDFISGIGVHLGHSVPELVDAALLGAIEDVVMQGNLQANDSMVTLIDTFRRSTGMDHVFLTTSGAMANENALKMAFQVRSPANRILAFENGFSGRSLALAAVTDRPAFREGIPVVVPVDYVPFFDTEFPDESTERTLTVLRGHLARYPHQHAAMIFEFIQGEGGVSVGSASFFNALIDLLRANGVLVIADEVQTFGRTSHLFAMDLFGVQDRVDMVTFGKLAQVCGTAFRKSVAPKTGLVSQTFIGSSTAIRASLAVHRYLTQENVLGESGKNEAIQRRFSERMSLLSEQLGGRMQGPWGIGSMCALTWADGRPDQAKAFCLALFDAGVLAFVAGRDSVRIRFLIPPVVSLDELDFGLEIICRTAEMMVAKEGEYEHSIG